LDFAGAMKWKRHELSPRAMHVRGSTRHPLAASASATSNVQR
jgi:hypothetical protein